MRQKSWFALLLFGGIVLAVFICWSIAGREAEQNDKTSARDLGSAQVISNSNPDDVLIKQLCLVMADHPDKSCRDNLWNWLQTGQIFFSVKGGPDDFVFARVTWDKHPQGIHRLVLIVNPFLLVNTRVDREVKQLVLYHEYQHILQARDGRLLKIWGRENKEAPVTQVELERVFELELEAYAAESRLALSKGWRPFSYHQVFQDQGVEGLKRVLPEIIAKSARYRPYFKDLRRIARSKQIAPRD